MSVKRTRWMNRETKRRMIMRARLKTIRKTRRIMIIVIQRNYLLKIRGRKETRPQKN